MPIETPKRFRVETLFVKKKKKKGPHNKGVRKNIDLETLKLLAGKFCTQQEACSVMGVDVATLHKRFHDTPAVRQAWDDGRAEGRVALRRLQFNYEGSAGVQMTIHMSKHQLGENDKNLVEVTGKDGGAIQLSAGPDLSSLTVDEKLALLAILEGAAIRKMQEKDSDPLCIDHETSGPVQEG
jgi:hypothetical protein